MNGAEIAAASVNVANAVDAASLDHERAWQTSGMKTPNDRIGTVAKNAPALHAPTTRHPSYRTECSFTPGLPVLHAAGDAPAYQLAAMAIDRIS